MIVCSCNVFTDHDVRRACVAAGAPPRTPGQVYGCLGCSAQCGRCARTIKSIMDEAFGTCARTCSANCPHSGAVGVADQLSKIIADDIAHADHTAAQVSAAA